MVRRDVAVCWPSRSPLPHHPSRQMNPIHHPTTPPAHELGPLLRHWRGLRNKSQLDLSLDSGVSQRHISFVEGGRSAPSRQMLLNIAQALDIPLRDRNTLLLAAGYAPIYSEDAW